jgi:hypothetical protein
MRGLIGILPWAIVLAIAGAAIWLLLDRQAVVGSWVLAAVLVGHGLVHGLYLVPQPEFPAGGAGPRWPFELARSWLVVLAGARRGRRIAALLIAAIVGASVLAALATVGILPAASWPGLVAAAAIASLVLLFAAFDIQLALGVGIDVLLLVVVVAGAWMPASGGA